MPTLTDYLYELFEDWDIETLREDLDTFEVMEYTAISTVTLTEIIRNVLIDKLDREVDSMLTSKEAWGEVDPTPRSHLEHAPDEVYLTQEGARDRDVNIFGEVG